MSSSSSSTKVNPVVLVSIDGWGLSGKNKGNAINNAKKPNMDRLAQQMFCRLDASGLSVGLPRGVMGNSEVGHLTMGCGRVQFQDLVRINESIADSSFTRNNTLVEAFKRASSGNGRLHFLGLVSDGGVHSHIDHLCAFLLAAKDAGVKHSLVHFFADGRDTAPTSGVKYVRQLQQFCTEKQYGKIATLMGRYYAMDRDKRWERIEIAMKALFQGEGEHVSSSDLVAAVEKRYALSPEPQTDEFLKPFVVDSAADSTIHANDTLIFFDFRSDRMREIVRTIAYEPPYTTTVTKPVGLGVYIMTKYDETFKLPILYPPINMDNVLAEWISKQQLRQYHTAETEKYAHITFFFNGGREDAFALEDRNMVASPKVATYDLQPEMSQRQVAESVATAVEKGEWPFIMCNFAAPDMVGHTGKYDKAVLAVESCDAAIGIIADACAQHNYTLVITADHGNAEEMEDENGDPKTAHTTNPIPLIIAPAANVKMSWVERVANANSNKITAAGLAAVAPTVLTMMGLKVPTEMTGEPLVKLA